jgi:hypothetical protein
MFRSSIAFQLMFSFYSAFGNPSPTNRNFTKSVSDPIDFDNIDNYYVIHIIELIINNIIELSILKIFSKRLRAY